jgi:putative hydrolase of the HAD superfamily
MDKQALRVNNIKAVVFDLGNVILNFDNRIISGFIASKSGADEEEIRAFIFGGQIEKDIDSGAITLETFLNRINERFSSNISLNEFEPVFCGVFKENKNVIGLIAALKKNNYRIGLLSNTNRPHFEFIKKKFPVVGLIDDFHLSYETGCVKPEKRAFENVLNFYSAGPGELVYIDDLEKNVNAALPLGINAVLFESFEQLSASLQGLGLNLS